MRYLITLIFLIYASISIGSDFVFTNPGVDARFEGGMQIKAVSGQANKFHYTFTKDAYFNGVETYCYESNNFDSIDLEVQYQAAPGVWYRYKKFGKSYYIAKGQLQKNVMFPAKPVAGMRIQATYNFGIASPLPANCMVNIFKFVDIEKVNPLIGQQERIGDADKDIEMQINW